MDLKQKCRNPTQGWGISTWEAGGNHMSRRSVTVIVVWHLGSLKAANWVSFDFNVLYSSCWGYSLINTLKLKKETGWTFCSLCSKGANREQNSPPKWLLCTRCAGIQVCITQMLWYVTLVDSCSQFCLIMHPPSCYLCFFVFYRHTARGPSSSETLTGGVQ